MMSFISSHPQISSYYICLSCKSFFILLLEATHFNQACISGRYFYRREKCPQQFKYSTISNLVSNSVLRILNILCKYSQFPILTMHTHLCKCEHFTHSWKTVAGPHLFMWEVLIRKLIQQFFLFQTRKVRGHSHVCQGCRFYLCIYDHTI